MVSVAEHDALRLIAARDEAKPPARIIPHVPACSRRKIVKIDLREALVSSGSGAELNLYVVMDASHEAASVTQPVGVITPGRSVRFPLRDENGVLGTGAIIEYDYYYDRIPEPLVLELSTILSNAIANGSTVAWLGLEGSFDFEYLLAAEVAAQVYGVATSRGELHVAIDDGFRSSAHWSEILRLVRPQIHSSDSGLESSPANSAQSPDVV